MVRLLNEKNMDTISDVIYKIFRFQEFFTHIKEVDNPNITPCIYAMWHCNQMAIYGIDHWTENFNILVSRSRDGQIIAGVVERWGFKVVHGSKGKKGSVEATMQMIAIITTDRKSIFSLTDKFANMICSPYFLNCAMFSLVIEVNGTTTFEGLPPLMIEATISAAP